MRLRLPEPTDDTLRLVKAARYSGHSPAEPADDRNGPAEPGHGSRHLFLAGASIDRNWRMRQGDRSPRYTTHWAEIPVALA